jgi:hypothetical protein
VLFAVVVADAVNWDGQKIDFSHTRTYQRPVILTRTIRIPMS